VPRRDQWVSEDGFLGAFHRFLTFISFKIFAARLANNLWAVANGVEFIALFVGWGLLFDPNFNGLDDPVDGPKRFDSDDRGVGFFIFISI